MKDGIIIDTRESIEMYRLLALRSALKAECIGLKFRGGGAAKAVRALIGSKTRSRRHLLAELNGYIAGVESQLGRKH